MRGDENGGRREDDNADRRAEGGRGMHGKLQVQGVRNTEDFNDTCPLASEN